jgi:hypothetical protein
VPGSHSSPEGLNINQLLSHHIPVLGYTMLTSPWEPPDGFLEPYLGLLRCHSWTVAYAFSLPLLKFQTHLNTVLHAGVFTNRR